MTCALTGWSSPAESFVVPLGTTASALWLQCTLDSRLTQPTTHSDRVNCTSHSCQYVRWQYPGIAAEPMAAVHSSFPVSLRVGVASLTIDLPWPSPQGYAVRHVSLLACQMIGPEFEMQFDSSPIL